VTRAAVSASALAQVAGGLRIHTIAAHPRRRRLIPHSGLFTVGERGGRPTPMRESWHSSLDRRHLVAIEPGTSYPGVRCNLSATQLGTQRRKR
jgi:hypothetical protein